MQKSVSSFIGVILLIFFLIAISIWGFTVGDIEIPSVQTGIKQGLDLKGGSTITYEAVINETEMSAAEIAQGMDSARTIIRNRLNSLGYTEATVQITNKTRLRVEIPAVTNPEEAVSKLGATALLEFRDADGKVELTGKDIKSAHARYGQTNETGVSQHYVELTFEPEAVPKFAAMTKAAASREEGKNYIAIVLDGEEKSVPRVGSEYASEGINSESCIITMGNTKNQATEAKWLADIINSGRLPFELRDVELRSIGPTLGERALSTSMLAGLIGLIMVLIFMIIMYRLPGVIASIALLFYVSLVAVVLAALGVNLSLPGIAGIILSIGMAVDANVLIYERLKEELRLGKTLKASVESSFKRAFTAILDSNVTTLIAAVVLYLYGTGPILGFAITLALGVLMSMFTVLVVSRFMLNQLVNMNIKSLKAYGV